MQNFEIWPHMNLLVKCFFLMGVDKSCNPVPVILPQDVLFFL